jgi:hypothetical protein
MDTDREQHESIERLCFEAKELLADCLASERFYGDELQKQLAFMYHRAPQQATQVNEALQLILQGKEELLQLLSLTKQQARQSAAATATLRRLDGYLRKVETALKLVQDLLSLRDVAQSLEKLLQTEDYDLDRACSLVAEFRHLEARSEFRLDNITFGSAEVTLLQQRMEDARQQLRTRASQLTEQLFVGEHRLCFDADAEQQLLAHLGRFRKLGCTAEAQQCLLRYVSECVLHQMSQRLALELSPSTKWLEQLTILYEAIAETVARLERISSGYEEDDRQQVLLQLEQLANERGTRILRGFLQANELERRCHQYQRALQRSARPSAAPNAGQELDTIYDMEWLQLGNGFHTDSTTTTASAQDPDRCSPDIDPSELEPILEQLVIMSRRTAMFRHFLLSRLGVTMDFEHERRREGRLYVTMQELMGMYVLLEHVMLEKEWHVARVQTEHPETSDQDQVNDPDRVSRFVEYTFYAIKRCTGRAIQAYDPEALCATLNHVHALLTGPFLDDLTKQLQSQLPSLTIFTSAQMVFGHRVKIESLQGLIRTTNDAQTSCAYLRRLTTVTIPKGMAQVQLPQWAALTPILMDMETAGQEFQQLVNRGIRTIFQTLQTSVLERAAEQTIQALVPRTRDSNPPLAWPYQPEESTYSSGPSVVVSRLYEMVYREALEPLLSRLVPEAAAELVRLVAEWTRDRFEEATLRRDDPMNALGALAFDADARYLMNNFAGLVEAHRASIRISFRRLIHIALVLTVDRPAEVTDLWEQVRDSLSAEEVYRLLRRRVEFRPEAIQTLNLTEKVPSHE